MDAAGRPRTRWSRNCARRDNLVIVRTAGARAGLPTRRRRERDHVVFYRANVRPDGTEGA